MAAPQPHPMDQDPAGDAESRWERSAARGTTVVSEGPADAPEGFGEPAPRSVQPVPLVPLQISSGKVRSYRFVRAYYATFVVVFSYLWLSSGRKLFGDTWYRQRMAAAHKRNARRVEHTVIALQGLFIKVGQLLSIMANFLPEEFRAGLERLQDAVPPRPYHEIEERIRQEFGRQVDAVFEGFERIPLASASLGQVHEARLRDGRRVAVKVQHKDVDEICRLDLKTIRRIMGIVSFFFPIRGLDLYYHQIREMISRELDFALEAQNIERIAANFLHDDGVSFPRVVPTLSTRRVLTTTFLEGVKIGDLTGLDAAGIDRKALARKIVRTYCQMIFVDGVYHADPHPGNLMAKPDGGLILLDFGAVAELSPEMREGIPEFLEAVMRRDTERLVRSMRKMRFLSTTSDAEVAEKIIEVLHNRFQDEVKLESFNLKDIKVDPQRGFENLLDLRRMDIGLKELSGTFQVPRDWVLLERTLLLLTGVCTQLDPQMNPMEVVRPYLQEFVLGSRDWTQIALEAAKDMAMQAVRLPEQLHKYLNKAVRGDLEVRVRGINEGSRLIYRAARQLAYVATGIACGLASLQLHLAGQRQLSLYCLAGTGAMAVLFFISAILAKLPKR